MRVDGIILAAGLSSRMGTNKLLLPFQGKSLLERLLDTIRQIPLTSRILVTREETASALSLPPDVRLVMNPHPEYGQSHSLRLGLEAATGDGFLFFVADQPFLNKATIQAILSHAAPERIVIPRYAGMPGTPVFFAAAFRQELRDIRGDQGGRSVVQAHPDACVFVDLTDGTPLRDMDTPEEYRILQKL